MVEEDYKSKYRHKLIESIENESILRKFTELFFLMSIVPLLVLAYLYLQLLLYGAIKLSPDILNRSLIIIVIGIVVGYISMRSVIKKIIDLTNANRKALERLLSPEKIKEIGEDKNEIAVLARSFSAITERLEENVKNLELAKKTLHSVLTKVGEGISNMQNIDTFLDLILETITDALGGRTGVLMITDGNKKSDMLFVKSVYDAAADKHTKVNHTIDKGSKFFSIFKSKEPLITKTINLDTTGSKELSSHLKAPLIATPLVFRDKSKGVIAICAKDINREFGQDEIQLISHLASQIAVAIENSHLSDDMEATYFETISALALAVDAKDTYSRGHLDRVANYCMMMAEKLGLDEEDKKTLRDAARLHDLGKIGIPDEVLKKEGPLSDHEWVLMRKHPEIGESIIKPIHSLHHLCDIIRHHHEKLDGSGYPDGLKKDDITPLVRITTIADIFDALTTNRSYRAKMTHKEACQTLRNMQDQLDQEIVEIFIETLQEQKRLNG
ncbi:MAG: HD domain-containing protein [Candidatus Omnitrophica bacterium]|nr:HD domain-containing protein [Candidatus Omnitrophota bacterium]